jgi:hypothetical protein
MSTNKLITLLLFFLILSIGFIILWQMFPGNDIPSDTDTVARHWSIMQPLIPTVTYDGLGENFTASFNNFGGTSIEITSIQVNESISGQLCETPTINGNSTGTGVTVLPGDDFKLVATRCPTLNRGDPYLMTIIINYTRVIGGVSIPLTQTGSIKGTVE